eukprot:s1339_g23.t1
MEGRKRWRSERVGFALEHPDVPAGDCLWATDMWAQYAEAFGMHLIQCGRGATGTNMDLQSARGLTSTTTSSGTWTDSYVQCMKNAVASWNGFPPGDSVLCYTLPGEKAVRIGKMTAKEWQLHVQRDHLPFRRDCRHCVQASSGRPHRRILHRSAYVLSADVAGPFRTKGRSTDTNQHKFMLVCAYQFPRLPGTPEVQLESTQEDKEAGLGGFFSEDGEKFSDPSELPADVEELAKEWSFSEAEDESSRQLPQGEGKEAIVEVEGDERSGEGKERSKEEREAAEASEPFDFSVAYFIRPLRSRRSGDVLRALQEVYIDLKMMGLPVNRLHADRAREFRTPAVSEWAASRDVQVTRTEGDAPAQNGAAEQAVKYVKSRTRILLSSAQELTEKPMKEVKTWWPMAAEAAVDRQRALAFGQEKTPPAGFGSKVFVKRKRYGVDAKDLDPKWGPAVYLGPARDVPGGHVVLTEDNHLWNTCNVRQLPDVPMEPDPSTLVTRRRILGKRPPTPPIPLKALRAPLFCEAGRDGTTNPSAEVFPVSEVKSVAKIEYLPQCDMMKPLAQISHERQWYSLEDCFAILEDTPFKKPNKTRMTEAWGDPGPDVYMTFGAYQHGSFVGVTNATREYGELVRYLTAFVRKHSGVKDPFTSLVVARNLGTGLHRDSYNVRGRRNVVISCGPYEQGGLWVEGRCEGLASQLQILPDGNQIEGSVVPTKNQVVKFNPRQMHKSLPWEGTKWTVIAYVNRGFSRLPEEGVQELRDKGFLLPHREEATLHQLQVQDDFDEHDYCNTSDEEELVLMGKAVTEDELVLLSSALDEEEKLVTRAGQSEFEEESAAIAQANDKARARCSRLETVAEEEFQWDDVGDATEWFRLCRMVEGDEQHGVEEVLRNLRAPLQVVYTMSLPEVKENVGAWKGAIKKEVDALISVLRNLRAPLQVVYTMSLPEVKENVGAWKGAIKKEVDALISCGALVRMDSAEEDRLRRDNRLVVLPAKGVFTVKPPDVVETTAESINQAASTKGVHAKSADQLESTEGVHAKSADQLESTEGVHAKSADQLESTEGVHAKSADQLESTEGVHAKSADQLESTEGANVRPADQTVSSSIVTWFKRKARLVICGNYEKHIAEDLYAGGCQTESLRVMISHASGIPDWDAAVTDIRNAFLLAPMATDAIYGLRFPKVFLAALGPEWDGLYRVDRALYGFRRSPRLWGLFRDARLRAAKFKTKSGSVVLRKLTADENVWKAVLIEEESEASGVTIAYLVIYVDDIMYLGENSVILEIHEWLSSEWKASDLTWASNEEGIRFLGLEIYKRTAGYFMCQLGYVTELLRHHGVSNGPGAKTPCPREWLLGEGEVEQTSYDESSLRRAQRITGELLWLSTKSRPDLMHAVASMSSLCLRDPILVERIGLRTLAYLYSTAHVGLLFSGVEGVKIQVTAYSDASFSPAGGRSVGSSVITYRDNPVAWKSGRQSLISLSTAECELIEAVTASQLQLGISMLVDELNGEPSKLVLLVDNSATVSLCNDAPGTWRTRHLRVRAASLREAAREGRIEIRHIAGIYQKADLGTKCFEPARLHELLELWGLVHFSESSNGDYSRQTTARTPPTSLAAAALDGLRKCWVCALARLVMVLTFLSRPAEGRSTKQDIEVSLPWELYVMIAIFIVAGIGIWELLKKWLQRWNPEEQESKEARRLRKLQAAVRDELQEYGLTGSSPLRPAASSPTTRPSPTFSPFRPPANYIYEGAASSHDDPPPPPPYPTGDDGLPQLEELRATMRQRRRSAGGTADQAVQTEPRRVQGEVTLSYGQTLFTTKGGKCVHSRSTCSSLVVGGRVDEKHLCQLCNR